jgi:N-acetylglucosamine kinase-like BadF-type ATPase
VKPAAVLAVDGGNSKTDVALVARDGRLLGAVHGPTVSHQQVGLAAGMGRLRELVAEAAAQAGMDPTGAVAELGVYSLAGADFPPDIRALEQGVGRLGLTDRTEVVNDTFGALRAGADKGWGIVLICGQGVNGAGIAPDGRSARFAAIGPLSGDWGGGGGLGWDALGAAIRARDGRGARTSLERAVARHFGAARPETVMLAMYHGRIPHRRLGELAPVVFAEAGHGDSVARGIVDRLADELAVMATALARRLRITRQEVDIVLAGGVFHTRDEAFYQRLADRVQRVVRQPRFVHLDAPPVQGAALLGLDRLATSGRADPQAAERLRSALRDWAGELSRARRAGSPRAR